MRNELPPELSDKLRIALLLHLRCPSASVIQTWLFFDLASEALGRDIGHGEFLEKHSVSSSGKSIDPRIPGWFWTELIARWRRLAKTPDRNEYKREENKLKDCCEFSTLILGLLEPHKDSDVEDGDTELALALLSVQMLLYLIYSIFLFGRRFRTDFKSRSVSLLARRVVESGWCQKRLNFLDSLPTHYPTFYFLSSLRPQRRSGENHCLCTPTTCQVMTKLAEPNHRSPGCQCQTVQVPLEPVLEIVAAGGIPLTRIKRVSSGGFSLEVVPYSRAIRFVAISHVWADRQLGSTKNALPGCQVEYLDSVLTALPRVKVGIHGLLNRWRSPRAVRLGRGSGSGERPL